MQSVSILALALSFVAGQGVIVPSGRIVGGYEVTPKFKYPWMASLQYKKQHTCGGTLYTDTTVISAAHCVIGSTSSWTALVHRHNLNQTPASESGVSIQVVSRVSHPDYGKNYNGNDVSIWKLDAKVPGAPKLKLDAGKYSETVGTPLKVIGWGTTSSGGNISPTLLEVIVPVFNSTKCKVAYPDLDSKSQFCAGFPEGGKDSCQGDSGGPMFFADGSNYYLTGVVSWGRGCALKGYPGVYTRVSDVSTFILNTAGSI
uniref:Putative trypsin-like serine protease n=1 Tax=Pandora neoaphidis TaxID=76017 RepID=E2EYY3_9FUNG|nr:putative trypsin-like serine protease precursor [Pandora neoaphidis]